MITKNDIKNSIQQMDIHPSRLEDLEIFTTEEYATVANCTVEEVFEVWGTENCSVIDFVVMYSDNPDYLFLKKNITRSELKNSIALWIAEIKIGRNATT